MPIFKYRDCNSNINWKPVANGNRRLSQCVSRDPTSTITSIAVSIWGAFAGSPGVGDFHVLLLFPSLVDLLYAYVELILARRCNALDTLCRTRRAITLQGS
jgi:hypothetical protein